MEWSYRNLSIFFNMDIFWCTPLVLIFSIFFIQKCFQKQKKKLPPSPPALPILGHLHLLRNPPVHRALRHLSNKYGPIVYLRFGNRPTLVVSSPPIAEECFTKNDIIFANRPGSIAIDHLSYNHTTMGSAPYGDHWRNLRRVTTIKIYSSTAINHFSAVRLQEIRFILKKLFSNSNETRKANLNSLFLELVFNAIMKMVSGKRWSEPYDMFDAEIPTGLCDFIPILRWIGYGGLKKKMQEFHEKGDKFMQDLIDETRRIDSISQASKHHKTIIQSLLSLQEADPEYYTDNIIKGIILVLFSAGTGTSALTMEWAMSLLLNHPEVMEKLRSEIEHHIPSERLIEDSDISKLPYLRCVICETLRLFPVAPLLLPHMSSEDCTISDYNVTRGITLMVNVWAIHRAPEVWEEPNKFKPERFEGFSTENGGFKFLPFGMGRRACPGYGMGMRLISLTLATLIQCFEWERIGPELVDLEEAAGFTLSKAKPLEAVYRPRPSMSSLLSQL